MTPDEFTAEVRRILGGPTVIGDPEESHAATDELMADVLTLLGYGEGVELIWTVPRWYA